MKKLFAILLALAAVILLVSCGETSDDNGDVAGGGSAAEITPEDVFLYEEIESEGAYRIVGIKRSYNVKHTLTLPSEHEGLPVVEVVSLGDWPPNRKFSSLNIPGSFRKIGDYVFTSRSPLMFLHLEEGLEEIGDGAFRNTDILILELPESLKTIGAGAFDGCKYIDTVHIPAGVTQIGERCFAACSELIEITVAEENSRYYSTENCLIDRQNKVLLAGCTTSTIPNDGSITRIGEGAFQNSGFPRAAVPEGVTEIGDYAFADCTNLRFLTLPDSLTTVGYCAFGWCDGLTEITLPDNVTTIGASAFAGSEKLKKVTFPAALTEIGDQLFDGCDSLTDVYFGGTSEQWAALIAGTDNSRLSSVTMHFGVAG